MHKPAPVAHPTHDLIQHRWSPRAFSAKPVPADILRSLFEAARWAPSSSNEQPWAFLVTTREDQEAHARMLSTLVEANQAWAKHAPVLAIAVAELAFARNGKPNRNAFYDIGAAVANLSLEATSHGLFVHQMAGFDPHKAIELFEIPSGWEPVSAFVVGYPGETASLPDPLRERETAPRERKPLEAFVMGGHWGKSASFLQK
ncbi:MAG TPA: nitroreductase family protein [Terriglobales bacterium]|nr:nitroreductase family protein [Terriglobales bacterium]